MTVIYTSAVVFRNLEGEVLTVRKCGTKRFMLVGGKPEPGETPLQTAVREAKEEVGIEVCPEHLTLLGLWQTAAANEPGMDVHCTTYLCTVAISDPGIDHEIAQLRWVDIDSPLPDDLAPMLVERVIPELHHRQAHPDAEPLFDWDVPARPC